MSLHFSSFEYALIKFGRERVITLVSNFILQHLFMVVSIQRQIEAVAIPYFNKKFLLLISIVATGQAYLCQLVALQ